MKIIWTSEDEGSNEPFSSAPIHSAPDSAPESAPEKKEDEPKGFRFTPKNR